LLGCGVCTVRYEVYPGLT